MATLLRQAEAQVANLQETTERLRASNEELQGSKDELAEENRLLRLRNKSLERDVDDLRTKLAECANALDERRWRDVLGDAPMLPVRPPAPVVRDTCGSDLFTVQTAHRCC